jgi:HPt (histidine-containing phosphotransfer) domain-containing protein
MTANAMASDREACLAAGMNDHVGKPFDLSNLVAILLRNTGRAAAAVATPEPRANALPDDLLEEAGRRGIDLNTAIGRMGGNRRAYLRMLHSFSEDLATLPDQLGMLLHQGRFDEAGRVMHTFKGLAATLGIRPLAQLASDAERALAAGAEARADQEALVENIRVLVVATRQDIAHVAEILRHESDTAPQPLAVADAAEPADMPGLQRSLDELMRLLRCADMRALQVFEQLQLTHAAHLHDALQPLDAAMASLDFDQALAQCQALTERFDK